MVIDIIENAARYVALNPGFAKAFEFLSRPDLAELATGEYVLDGDKVYATIVKTKGREVAKAKTETHKRYIDIQMVLGGEDSMGWIPTAKLSDVSMAYDDKRDLEFFHESPESWQVVKPGYFAIFFPEDGHMPLIGTGDIHKIVVKVAA